MVMNYRALTDEKLPRLLQLKPLHPNGHGKCAALNNETRDARAPSLRSPSDGTTSHLTKLQKRSK